MKRESGFFIGWILSLGALVYYGHWIIAAVCLGIALGIALFGKETTS